MLQQQQTFPQHWVISMDQCLAG